jgi:CelD/BcsL family acetyltransferase involved in cellulose biosynthesis
MCTQNKQDTAQTAHTTGDIRSVSLEALEAVWQGTGRSLDWRCLFTLPPWLKSWWSAFGDADESRIVMMDDAGEPFGLVPLRIRNASAQLMGSPDVCDYLDIIVVPERRHDMARLLFAHLAEAGIKRLVCSGVRRDAVIWTRVLPYARECGWQVSCEKEAVSFDIELPESWEAFLYRLDGKQRHEIRRKLRRLNEAGDVQFRMIDPTPGSDGELDRFIDLFKASRTDKRAFMTPRMSGFFRSLVWSFSGHRILKFGELALSGRVIAMVMCFDYRSTRYLYNSGYDPRFRKLSVGLISKIFGIRDAIETGISRFDFLKGEEIYKQRLGGVVRDIYRCTVHLP